MLSINIGQGTVLIYDYFLFSSSSREEVKSNRNPSKNYLSVKRQVMLWTIQTFETLEDNLVIFWLLHMPLQWILTPQLEGIIHLVADYASIKL